MLSKQAIADIVSTAVRAFVGLEREGREITSEKGHTTALEVHSYRSNKGCYDASEARQLRIAFNPTRGRTEAELLCDEPEDPNLGLRQKAHYF